MGVDLQPRRRVAGQDADRPHEDGHATLAPGGLAKIARQVGVEAAAAVVDDHHRDHAVGVPRIDDAHASRRRGPDAVDLHLEVDHGARPVRARRRVHVAACGIQTTVPSGRGAFIPSTRT